MPAPELPSLFRQNIQTAFKNGAAWIESLPSLIADCEQRWGIFTGEPFSLSYSFVAPAARTDGSEVVLKICVPNPELQTELAALRLYAGGAAVRLLDADEDRGCLLLERLVPGQMLTSIESDEEATRIAAGVMRNLWKPLPDDHKFPTAGDWTNGLKRLRERFGGGTGPFPSGLVELAESLFAELLASSETPVLVHGDLHHDNILTAQRRVWVAIDPKGLAAEPAYEVGALLRNPTLELRTDVAVQRRRVEVLAEELGLDRERIVAWGVAQAVLSEWWGNEDGHSGWDVRCACAETLRQLL